MTVPMRPRVKWHMLRSRRAEPPHLRDNLARVLAAGATGEVDIVFTADGHPVCLHDLTLDRETTGCGPVAARTRAEIEALRQRGAEGEALSTAPLFLSEVIEAVRAAEMTEASHLQLDLKEPTEMFGAASLSRLADLIRPVARHIVVGGTDWSGLELIRDLVPDLRLGFDPLDWYGSRLPARADWYRALGRFVVETAPEAAIYYLEARLVLAGLDHGVDLVAEVTARGAEVDAWTIDASRPDVEADLRRLIAAGCRQITTNDPLRITTLVEEIVS